MTLPPQLYADTADIEQACDLLERHLIRGVTTNPTLLEISGHRMSDLPHLYEQWVGAGAAEIFFQTWGADAVAMRENAERIREIGERVVVKVPATTDGFSIASELADDGAAVLLTAVSTAAQALVAACCGVRYIAAYLGRLRDAGQDGLQSMEEMVSVCASSRTLVLAASLRSPRDLVDLHHGGVRAFTANPSLIRQLLDSSATNEAAGQFEAAAYRIA